MTPTSDRYVAALGLRCLTALYDPLVAATTRERRFKHELLRQAALKSGARVLDLGCGTGTLAISAKRMCPEAWIVGVDGDSEVLARARAKAGRAGADIRFQRALSFALPFPADAFDVVLSTLFFHHLGPSDKRRTMREVYRVLAPGGRLHVADWGRPANALARALFVSVQLLDGFATTADNVAGRLPQYMTEAGLAQAGELGRHHTVYGTLAFYQALKPGGTAQLAHAPGGRVRC